MVKHLEVIKKQDFGEWVNIDLFKDVLYSRCKGKLQMQEVNTLSNMFSIIFAMKARDYVQYKTDKKPLPIEEYAQKCANNLYAYLQNYPLIKRDWLELFMIGYAGETISLQNKEHEYSIKVAVNNDLEDDDYAINSALFVSSLDERLTEEQQRQISSAVIQRSEARKNIVQARLTKVEKQNRWHKTLRGLVYGHMESKQHHKSNRHKFIPLVAVIRGTITALGMIVATKLFPTLGFFSVMVGGIGGYLISTKLSSEVNKSLAKALHHILLQANQHAKTGEVENNISKPKEVSNEVTKLKQNIRQEIKSQQEVLTKVENNHVSTRGAVNSITSIMEERKSHYNNTRHRSGVNFEKLLSNVEMGVGFDLDVQDVNNSSKGHTNATSISDVAGSLRLAGVDVVEDVAISAVKPGASPKSAIDKQDAKGKLSVTA